MLVKMKSNHSSMPPPLCPDVLTLLGTAFHPTHPSAPGGVLLNPFPTRLPVSQTASFPPFSIVSTIHQASLASDILVIPSPCNYKMLQSVSSPLVERVEGMGRSSHYLFQSGNERKRKTNASVSIFQLLY